jgi:hypothetical protein
VLGGALKMVCIHQSKPYSLTLSEVRARVQGPGMAEGLHPSTLRPKKWTLTVCDTHLLRTLAQA